VKALHHAAVCTRDVDRALSFYHDGLGLDVLMDREFDGDWPGLFAARDGRLRSIFLGDARSRDACIVELVAFPSGAAEAATPSAEPTDGFFLLSFFVDDLDAALTRLGALGLADGVRRIAVPGPSGPVAMATIRDPDGVLIELIDGSSAAT
jgi:catechol 2,3-dioxygenase-like lactoylglutathione lyase family enzyme